MYEASFQLGARPFVAVPHADRYFPAAAIESARKTVTRCLERAEGPALVVGRSGTGKSLLCEVLAGQLEEAFVTVLLASGRLCTRRALLQAILFELGLPYRGVDEGELRLALIDYLTPTQPKREALVLLVDEAHTLPLRLLEELRLLSNVVSDGQSRMRIVLAGGPALEERFASPKLDSFSQRIAARCYLESLGREETIAYVKAQIVAVGGIAERVFDQDALSAVHRATDGIPRLINQVCDHALVLASAAGRDRVTAAIIEEAWADLQQLPTPWTAADGEPQRQVVEFGRLDDPGDDLPEAIPFRTARETAFAPDEHLDRIEEQLLRLEEEFEPAGSIGPEVELMFHDTGNPFSEVFAEEEVLLDRYASMDEDILTKRPSVTSREGREISAILAQHQLSLGSVESREVRPAAQQSPPAASPTSDIEDFYGEDEDLIIVEDDPPKAAGAAAEPLVRRQEYRQLFAKLRRGY